MSEAGVAGAKSASPGPASAPITSGPGAVSVVRGWALWVACVLALTLLLDSWAEGLAGAGRVFLIGLLTYHLVLVPARRSTIGLTTGVREAVGLAVATIPLTEIVRGMTGGSRTALLQAALVIFAAHGVGVTASAVGRRRPSVLRWCYWPLLVVLGAAMPLVAYAAVEFFGCGGWPLDGAVFGPVVRLLDAAP